MQHPSERGAGKTLEALGWLRALGWDSLEVGTHSGTAPAVSLDKPLSFSQPQSLICKMGIYLPQSISLMVVNTKCYNLGQWLKILASTKITWKPGKKKTHHKSSRSNDQGV